MIVQWYNDEDFFECIHGYRTYSVSLSDYETALKKLYEYYKKEKRQVIQKVKYENSTPQK